MSKLTQTLIRLQKLYPAHVLLFRRNDFYAAIGRDARRFAKLTGNHVDASGNMPTVCIRCRKLTYYELILQKAGVSYAIVEDLSREPQLYN